MRSVQGLVLLLSLSFQGHVAAELKAPVVGIYPSLGDLVNSSLANLYYRGYRQWLEQFGATTVVLPADGDPNGDSFSKLDALLFPGGPTKSVTPFARGLINRAIQEGAAGEYFPIWGTCLGFEWIVEAAGGVESLQIGAFAASDLATELTFSSTAGHGRMWAAANETVMGWLQAEDITYMNHEDGIEPGHFEANAPLAALFDVVATSLDRKGRRGVAAMQARGLPIYGVQFHPEKIRFVPGGPVFGHIPKTPEAMAAADVLASFFVSEAKKGAAMRSQRVGTSGRASGENIFFA
eukprot:CAMPEP_0203867896 /NCGR_PEP_ID=MMETSP0359-20131031/16797_1 /ASSEMBLY_ACC=CAM_ASM_000338 /TAXON_ID=268821 /ORGANISM="Scrippsiella Hangoei, Strain SHTV-5" /LENGTH=293 /DNA_ID=CAMNT_0050786227 /DNA_START=60 /DNA_END=941 /DNA_ORIENTATION=-